MSIVYCIVPYFLRCTENFGPTVPELQSYGVIEFVVIIQFLLQLPCLLVGLYRRICAAVEID